MTILSIIVCRIPFNAEKHAVNVIQGFHGPFSHYDLTGENLLMDLSFALDFQLSIGTEIIAAKCGVIKIAFDRSRECYEGGDPSIGNKLPSFSTNLVVVDHKDGTFAMYSHLMRQSLRVRTGQNVSEGEILACTGRSGWIGPSPHLHFFMYKEEPIMTKLGIVAKRAVSIPLSFSNFNGLLEHSELFG